MKILVNVTNQKLSVTENYTTLVSGTQKFIKLIFDLDEDWDDLLVFAQFRQESDSYNVYLDSDNSAYLPAEIEPGTCTVMLYGTDEDVIGTTNYLTLTIDENYLVSDAQSTDISQSLYAQLTTMFNTLSNSKVDAVAGKGLSTNDYTNAEKAKLGSFSEATAYALKSDIESITNAEIIDVVSH